MLSTSIFQYFLDNLHCPSNVTDVAGGQHDWGQPQHSELSHSDVLTSAAGPRGYRAAVDDEVEAAVVAGGHVAGVEPAVEDCGLGWPVKMFAPNSIVVQHNSHLTGDRR